MKILDEIKLSYEDYNSRKYFKGYRRLLRSFLIVKDS